ncbi:hypothetical protein [Desulfatitalea tepidiphila]|uniref:hypothetical protein n=1 Tax=Desulfatitalea tepidiphila TaxID=1185843 RepID=UPI0006B48E42|nr:hypothetical protein [Desulfatitalea tepidiphila]
MVPTKIDELIQLLAKHELSIAALYETFASKLPETKQEWLVFAEEERLHAKWVDKLNLFQKEGRIPLESTKFTVQSVKTAIDYVEKQIERASKEPPDLKRFLNMAIDIEKSLLETAFFRLFKLTAPEAQKVRTRLEEATKVHIQKLIEWKTRIN